MNKTKIIETLGIIVLAAVVVLFVLHFRSSFAGSDFGQPVATVLYSCNNKGITAVYYNGETKTPTDPDQPPTPGGSVVLTLADGSTMTLPQTISADGARYANADESFVFWEKGNSVMVLENGAEKKL